MNNKNNNTITAQENINNLDLLGKTIIGFCTSGKSIDPVTASLLAVLVADCRVYSTARDADRLSDIGSDIIKKVFDEVNPSSNEETISVSEVADSIIADLRNSGINI